MLEQLSKSLGSIDKIEDYTCYGCNMNDDMMYEWGSGETYKCTCQKDIVKTFVDKFGQKIYEEIEFDNGGLDNEENVLFVYGLYIGFDSDFDEYIESLDEEEDKEIDKLFLKEMKSRKFK